MYVITSIILTFYHFTRCYTTRRRPSLFAVVGTRPVDSLVLQLERIPTIPTRRTRIRNIGKVFLDK